jgi:hypothetical protein
MPCKLTIEIERYCRFRAYRVYSTCSPRGYYKETTREVDWVLPSRDTLVERREKLQIFKCSVDPLSPHLGALNPSLSLDLDGGIRQSPKRRGKWGTTVRVRQRSVNAIERVKRK